jgi:hypothetical protein
VSLKTSVHALEDAIITLSGPALAISGIIAGVDLLTGGNMLKQIWWLSLAWAIALLLSLDFNVLTLGVRSKRIYTSDASTRRKVCELLLAVGVAVAISYVSAQMQSIVARTSSAGLSIDQAAMQLGINLIALTWERSILVLALIFLSGWFRDGETDSASTVRGAHESVLAGLQGVAENLKSLQEIVAKQVPAPVQVSHTPMSQTVAIRGPAVPKRVAGLQLQTFLARVNATDTKETHDVQETHTHAQRDALPTQEDVRLHTVPTEQERMEAIWSHNQKISIRKLAQLASVGEHIARKFLESKPGRTRRNVA